MTYTPTVWDASTELTSTRLNNAESQHEEATTDYTAHVHTDDYFTKAEMDSTFWNEDNDGSDSGSDADLLYSSVGNKHAADMAGMGVPTGLIIMWYGSIVSIPSGWHLCDGTGGTIDLRDKFVVGAGGTYSVGDTGGSNTFTASGTVMIAGHILTTDEMGQHRHPFTDNYAASNPYSAAGATEICSRVNHTGTTSATGGGGSHGHEGSSITANAVDSRSPTMSLCYIQKI